MNIKIKILKVAQFVVVQKIVVLALRILIYQKANAFQKITANK